LFFLSAVKVYRRPVEFLHHLRDLLQRAIVTWKLGMNSVSPPDEGGTSQNRITVLGNSLI
jgi:hypothetical protein